LLIHKNEGLLKKIIREWHLYTLRAFKKRITEKMKKKTSVEKKKKPKKSTRRFLETDDQQSDSRSINIQIKNKSFESSRPKKYSSTRGIKLGGQNFTNTSLKSSLK
jgi:hypothetical protein